ncbi:hypothetical protein BDB00DRAFT_879487 [Zychaea mexicana]|uniref:uncharacterized protein n=1 Tax=Zychaea mexicana TaxID=64656 RepID=UPI0022FE181E|nr:uncharacterized protein BDB00DRAFT_879487 [Zychaea mexicana]KAI9477118.1 hypothetical protein BDB00DRAFT_879487 [Zychaea mexicana]
MALSDSHQKQPDRSTGITHPPPIYPSSPTVITWAKVAQPERVSLVHAHRVSPSSDQPATTYYSRIWRIGRSKGSVLFDVSPVPGTTADVVATLMTEFPDNYGILIHREGKRVIFEFNLKHDSERQRVIEEGVSFTNDITIRATPALDKTS